MAVNLMGQTHLVHVFRIYNLSRFYFTLKASIFGQKSGPALTRMRLQQRQICIIPYMKSLKSGHRPDHVLFLKLFFSWMRRPNLVRYQEWIPYYFSVLWIRKYFFISPDPKSCFPDPRGPINQVRIRPTFLWALEEKRYQVYQ